MNAGSLITSAVLCGQSYTPSPRSFFEHSLLACPAAWTRGSERKTAGTWVSAHPQEEVWTCVTLQSVSLGAY